MEQPQKLPLQVAGAFYINLDSRQDRREQLEGELAKIGITGCERFPAIKRNPGILGCGYSHLGVLKEAKQRGYASVLIFEDDFEFLVDKDTFWRTMDSVTADLSGANYDVIMLGYYVPKSVPHTANLMKVMEAQAPSAYIVHSRMYDRLISLYEWAMPLLQVTGEHWEYANDQVWKCLQPNSEWYATMLRIGRQRASFSDCNGAFANYGI